MKRLFLFLISLVLAGCGQQVFAPPPGHPAHAETSPGGSLPSSDVLDLAKREPVDVPNLSPTGKSMHHMKHGHMRHPGEGKMPMKMNMKGMHSNHKTMQDEDAASSGSEKEMTHDE